MARVKLGFGFEGVSGRVGGVVLTRGRSGLVARSLPTYRRPTSDAQRRSAYRMSRASGLWRTLSFEQAEAWRRYAETVTRHDPLTGQPYHSSGYNAFMELTLRAIQASPDATPPLDPPATEFEGDGVRFIARAEPGTLVWEADGLNAPGVTVELLTQRLLNVRRKPTKQFKSQAFVRFEVGHPTHALEAEPGIYVLAVRELDAVTGQARELVPLGVVQAT